MNLFLKVCDILSEKSEAILMTIDGEIQEPDGSPAWGNVGQAARRRCPEYMKEVERQLDLPITHGDSQIVDLSGHASKNRLSFNYIGAISALDHLGSRRRDSNYLLNSILRAMGDLAFFRVKSIISTMPTGGWRVPPEESAHIIETVRREFIKWDTKWIIGDYNNKRLKQIFPIAKRFGWTIKGQ